ncbi:DNA internalization-related competence protein ComEC/Rec2 [Loigolactobacillus backii]|uniref:DNA internalization-related competence protein ComEC/Rec2 n=1 Tax=Loigolactobacillus backii TaxID=375175 RepID=UPI000C1CC0F9|nr:DNA internalization-related competence protein ComEC/Rec2 [Loigolactobacillus backii]PIO83634.1 DNA internalization-related competence protein ComEC/Rec2 [Loigolactobacillus backii]
MKDRVIFVALIVVALSFVVFMGNLMSWLFLVVAIVRLIWTRQPKLILGTVIVCCFVGSFLGVEKQRPVKRPTNYQRILVWPDAFKLNGDSLQFEGKLADKTRVLAVYYLQTKAEQAYFQHLTHPVILQVSGTCSRPEHATNQNEFDYATYLKQQRRINYIVQIEQIRQIQAQKWSLVGWLHHARQVLSCRADRYPPLLRQYFKCLVLGIQTNSFQDTAQQFKRLGLIHLFSLSGLHVFYFVGLFSQLLLRLHLTKETRDWLLLLLLPAYVIFAGSSVSLIRAVSLCWLRVLNRRFSFQISALDCFGWVLLFNFAVQPYVLLGLGGQLSYLLSFLLLFLRDKNAVFKTLWLNLFSLPILLHHVYEWHYLLVLLNLLVMPLFSYAVLPLTLIGAGCFSFLPGFSWLINWGLAAFQTSLLYLARPQWMIVFGRLTGTITLILLILTAIMLTVSKKYRISMGLFLGSIYLTAFLLIHYPLVDRVIFFDIGQGDSILIESRLHKRITLIDTGGRLTFNQAGWRKQKRSARAERVTINYLKSRGIKRIDRICLSHQDADHIGDLAVLLEEMTVKEVAFPAGMENNPQFRHRIWPYRQQIKWRPLQTGAKIQVTPQEELQVLHPERPGLGTNEDSLVLYGQIGGKTWLFTGDLDAANEVTLCERQRLKADFLKAGHHGSRTASAQTFLETVQPERILISSGRNNRYGHPHSDVIQRYQDLQIPFYNTAENGMLLWSSTDGWQTFRHKE